MYAVLKCLTLVFGWWQQVRDLFSIVALSLFWLFLFWQL
uniref:Uncharacterized protein n=1 Tax=Arundo donax TaxID=35708 RepID=A0A0A8YBY5_ARUDO